MPIPPARLMLVFVAVAVCCLDAASAAEPRSSVDEAATADGPAVINRSPAVKPSTAVEQPTAVDKRLAIELFAAEPEHRHAHGNRRRRAGRVLVIESHTHFRPKDYPGPPADRIRLFEDADGDGRSERITTFFEGTKYTMNLAFDRERRPSSSPRETKSSGCAIATATARPTNGQQIARLDTPGRLPAQRALGLRVRLRGQRLLRPGREPGAPTTV